jgi:hypothetical protein
MVVLVKVAVPFESLPVARVPVASLNVTVSPSGGVPDGELTVAVRVTLVPTAAVPGETFKLVVETFCTTCCTAGDVLGAKLGFPLL